MHKTETKGVSTRLLCLVLLGNVLDYYDFMLFTHLGQVVTSTFIPNASSKENHLLSLLLFAMPFVVRPIGGYIFGRISDLKSRQHALITAVKYASLTSFAIAILPSCHSCGVVCAWVFLLLRLLQGVYLGGEYTTAGVFLMEQHKSRKSLISSILVMSCTLGSLAAFGFAWLYLHKYITGEWWRAGFMLGGVGAYVTYLLRRSIKASTTKGLRQQTVRAPQFPYWQSVTLTLLIGASVSVHHWIPMVYTNFYLTQIMNFPVEYGLKATFIGLMSCLVFNPIFGLLADMYSKFLVMTLGALLSVPLGIIGFYMIKQGLLAGQILLVVGASAFGAPVHAMMNDLFSRSNKAANINTFFMIGASIGALLPFIAGYCANRYQINNVHMVTLAVIGLTTFLVFYFSFYRTSVKEHI